MPFPTGFVERLRTVLAAGADALDLCIRLYVGRVFLLSGLSKLGDWDATLALFRDEYRVPLLPPAVAALAGTFGETVFPVFLVLGLGARFAALGLTVVNIVAVVSYWHVLSTTPPALARAMSRRVRRRFWAWPCPMRSPTSS